MLNPITIRYSFRPVRRSLATGQVADLFGLAETEPPHLIAENTALDIRPGDLVLFTGPSGSGKSSLLREAGKQLGAVDAMTLELPDLPLIDALSGNVEQRLDLLASCGLSEARLLLRTPSELSDGQRYRFRLAFALSAEKNPSPTPPRNGEGLSAGFLPSPLRGGAGGGVLRFLMADEFAAYLDRTLAKVLAFNLRKLVTRTGAGILLATTHEDLTDDLQPDLWVRCLGEGNIDCVRSADRLKKNGSASPTNCGSPKGPDPTGRTSLGGITAATISPTSGGSSSSGTDKNRSESASSRRRPPR